MARITLACAIVGAHIAPDGLLHIELETQPGAVVKQPASPALRGKALLEPPGTGRVHPARAAILALLARGPLNSGAICAALGMPDTKDPRRGSLLNAITRLREQKVIIPAPGERDKGQPRYVLRKAA